MICFWIPHNSYYRWFHYITAVCSSIKILCITRLKNMKDQLCFLFLQLTHQCCHVFTTSGALEAPLILRCTAGSHSSTSLLHQNGAYNRPHFWCCSIPVSLLCHLQSIDATSSLCFVNRKGEGVG